MSPLRLLAARLAALGLALLLGVPCPAAAADETPEEYYRTGRYAESIEAADELLAENDRRESPWVMKLRAQLAIGRYEDAAQTYMLGVRRHSYSLQLRWLGQEALRLSQDARSAEAVDSEFELLLRRAPWQFSDAANRIVIGRWFLKQGADPKQVLKEIYSEVKKREPRFVDLWLAIGDMALDKHDYQLAGESFQQAVKIEPTHPAALLGVAKAFAPSDSEKAEAALKASLEQNPRFVDALLMVVDSHIDAERYDLAFEALDKIHEVNPLHPSAHAYRAVLAHLRNVPEKEEEELARALKPWPENPEVEYIVGLKLSQKYRFKEGAAYQRRALKHDQDYRPAKAQLAQDLMRLGQEEEGLKLAEEVHEEDAYDVFAFNLVTLAESLKKFRTIEEDGLLVRMDANEAEIYGPRVVRLLKRAKETLTAKYNVALDQPIIVELFPRQQDFAIRTFGMPGGAGFLGVCFGNVVTAPSPGSPAAGSSCWEATLWHEFCHVITLHKTLNKMPRWLSEGISVYEERQADPTWGARMTPQFRAMLLSDDFTPVSQLSGAFLSPKTPMHLQFAYFESSLVVEYLIEQHGPAELERILNDLATGISINETLARTTGILEELDEKFAAWAKEKANAFCPDVDWSAPELAENASPDAIAAWVKEHPTNYTALKRLAAAQLGAKQWKEATETLVKLKELCPQDAGSNNAYALLGQIYRETGDAEAERAVLDELAMISSDAVGAFDRLSETALAANDWEGAKKYVVKSLAVNPQSPAVQRRAATIAEKLSDWPWAIESCQALSKLTPFDAAELHYRLAIAQQKQGNLAEARRHALLALEETPRYRAAQQLLLEIVAVAGVSPPSVASPPDAAKLDASVPQAQGQ